MVGVAHARSGAMLLAVNYFTLEDDDTANDCGVVDLKNAVG